MTTFVFTPPDEIHSGALISLRSGFQQSQV